VIRHTPGPWAVEPYSHGAGDVRVSGPRYLPRPRFGSVAMALANLAGPMNADCIAEMHANARLIAAAPDLLAAAERVTAAFRALGTTTNVSDQMQAHQECEAAMVALDAAIKQALAA
jgi:hypothetical protein